MPSFNVTCQRDDRRRRSSARYLAASSPAIDLGCEMCAQYLLKDDISTQRLEMRDGALVVPDGPGLGVGVDEDKLARYREGAVERMEWRSRAPASATSCTPSRR